MQPAALPPAQTVVAESRTMQPSSAGHGGRHESTNPFAREGRRIWSHPAASPARSSCSPRVACTFPESMSGSDCDSPMAAPARCTAKPWSTAVPPRTHVCWSWSSDCTWCAAGHTRSSAGRASSIRHCSSASPASFPSYGWRMTSTTSIAASMNGTAQPAPSTTPDALWRILELGCVPGSIHYVVLPGLRRNEVLTDLHLLDAQAPLDAAAWWRPVAAA